MQCLNLRISFAFPRIAGYYEVLLGIIHLYFAILFYQWLFTAFLVSFLVSP
jgi:hypothetical protein